MTYILDTHAWVEYFIGSKKGKRVKDIMGSAKRLITVDCCIAELLIWSKKNDVNFDMIFEVVQANSELARVGLNDWIDGAKIRETMRKTRKRFCLIDAILVKKQKDFKAKVVSGDPHFKGLKKTVFLS